MIHPKDIPHIMQVETGTYHELSTATIYKMNAALLHLVDSARKTLPAALYQDMYDHVLHLSTKQIQRLYATLQAGRTHRVFSFLKKRRVPSFT